MECLICKAISGWLEGLGRREGWMRTGFSWEDVFVFNQSLEGGHDGVNVGRRGERNNFASMVDPWVVQPARSSS